MAIFCRRPLKIPLLVAGKSGLFFFCLPRFFNLGIFDQFWSILDPFPYKIRAVCFFSTWMHQKCLNLAHFTEGQLHENNAQKIFIEADCVIFWQRTHCMMWFGNYSFFWRKSFLILWEDIWQRLLFLSHLILNRSDWQIYQVVPPFLH